MISVIVPAYREGANVDRAVREINSALQDIGRDYEIVAIDDGSPDDTYSRLQSLVREFPKLRPLQHAVNQGPGAAFRTGFREARGDQIITIDCDLSFDPKEIPRLLHALQDADVAIGAQHGDGSAMRNIPWLRVAFSKLAYFLDRLFLGGNLPSYSSFFVAYRAEVIKPLHFDGNGFDAQCEVNVRLSRQGRKIAGVPTTIAWRDRKRKSSMRIFNEGKKRMRLWWRFNRFSRVPA